MDIILTQSNITSLELYGKKRISTSSLKGCLIARLLSSQQMWHLNVGRNGQMKEAILRNI